LVVFDFAKIEVFHQIKIKKAIRKCTRRKVAGSWLKKYGKKPKPKLFALIADCFA